MTVCGADIDYGVCLRTKLLRIESQTAVTAVEKIVGESDSGDDRRRTGMGRMSVVATAGSYM